MDISIHLLHFINLSVRIVTKNECRSTVNSIQTKSFYVLRGKLRRKIYIYVILFIFLAHLGQRLKLAFLIKICPLSVVVVGVVAFHIFILSRTTWPISTKLGTMHPWVRGIQFCSNEGPRTFPRGDNFKWKHVKFIAYSRTSIYSNIDYQEMSMKLLRWTRWNQYRSKDWPYDSYYWKPLLVVLFRTVQAIQLKVWYHNIPSDKIQLSFLELWFKSMKYVNGKSSLLINQLESFLTENILI